jgi:3-hydroxyisobutyrate dehydrogenase-like beta-hydroxyacid dehydrogenase
MRQDKLSGKQNLLANNPAFDPTGVAESHEIATLEQHRSAGVGNVAAPVLGRPHLAASGQLNIVAAGPAEDIERARPFLDVLGMKLWSVDDEPARPNLVKIAVNYNLIHTLQALAESVTMVEGGEVSGDTFIEILTAAAYTGSDYGVTVP